MAASDIFVQKFATKFIVHVLASFTGDIKEEEILLLLLQKVFYEKHFKVW